MKAEDMEHGKTYEVKMGNHTLYTNKEEWDAATQHAKGCYLYELMLVFGTDEQKLMRLIKNHPDKVILQAEYKEFKKRRKLEEKLLDIMEHIKEKFPNLEYTVNSGTIIAKENYTAMQGEDYQECVAIARTNGEYITEVFPELYVDYYECTNRGTMYAVTKLKLR